MSAAEASSSSSSDGVGHRGCHRAGDPVGVHQADQSAENFCVDLRLETDETDPPLARWLDVELVRLAQLAGIRQGLVGLVIVDDARMIQLHERYRQVADTTDVLTFNMRDGSDRVIEGDVVVCLDQAARQASKRGHTLRQEVLLYALHGLLHLLGYDDGDPADAVVMHRREDDLLIAAGFGPVYYGQTETD